RDVASGKTASEMSSRRFGWSRYVEVRRRARTLSTLSSTRHSRRTPCPTIPVAPKRMTFISGVKASAADVHLGDVGAEEEGDRPVEDDSEAAGPSRHLEQIVSTPQPTRRKAGQL